MSWVVIALAGAAISGIVSIFDKTVIYRYATTPRTLPLLIGVAQTSVGVVVLAIVRVPPGAEWEPVLWALVSGAVFGLSAQFLMHVLFGNEVSRTIPIFQSYPIFTAIYAFFFLGEDLGAVEWLAVAVVVAGTVLISFRPGSTSVRSLLLDKAFVLLMIGSAIHGSAHIFGKVAVDELPVLFTHGLRSIALGGVFLAFNLRRRPLDDVISFVRTRSPALRFVAMNELIIATVGLLLLLWALALGPAALVTALTGARSFFLVVYSTALALVWKGALGEVTTPGVVAVKLASTALIVGGVAAIALGSG
ncbi:MAG: EamA family transporter [Chloroflexi bacterium]|nr:EamA family transporter [Chloroflexota bacterium]